MKLPANYDEDEVRDGFFVSGMMKRVWASEIRMLYEFDQFCRAHGLRWFLAYGSLLGAVRHGGFVPWDDDCDIWMMREDFNRLYQLLNCGEDQPAFYVQETRNGEYSEMIPVLSNNMKRICFDQEYLDRNEGCQYCAGLDTFVLDATSSKEEDEHWRDLGVQACINLMIYLENLEKELEEQEISCKSNELTIRDIKEYRGKYQSADEIFLALEQLRTLTNHPIDAEQPLLGQVDLLYTGLIAYFRPEEGEYFRVYPEHLQRKLPGFRKEWFAETKYVPFENVELPIPAGYDQLLTNIYGNYHVIYKGTALHEYPFFKGLEKEILAYADRDVYNFHLRADLCPNLEERSKNPKKQLSLFRDVLNRFDDLLSMESVCADPVQMVTLLSDMQKNAGNVASLMESRLPESDPAFAVLQGYCDALYHLYEGMASGEISEEDIGAVHQSWREVNDAVRNYLRTKEIVFVVDRARHWPAVEPLWRVYKDRPDTRVFVVVPDYCRKKADTSFKEEKYSDLAEMPEEASAMPAENYSYALRHPEVMIVQSGCDEYNYTRSVDIRFYTRILWKYTDRLIYIPWYHVEDFSDKKSVLWKDMRFYANIPGPLYADFTVLQSEQMKRNFMDFYHDEEPGIDEEYWDQKLLYGYVPEQTEEELSELIQVLEGRKA